MQVKNNLKIFNLSKNCNLKIETPTTNKYIEYCGSIIFTADRLPDGFKESFVVMEYPSEEYILQDT